MEYPKGIKESDTVWPKYNKKTYTPVKQTYEFYKTERFGWVMLVLHIRNASSNQKARGIDTQRSYAICIESGKICTVGLGPHVKEKFTLHVTEKNEERLEEYIKLFCEGSETANSIRDRISSRRANTIARRLQSWY